MHAPPRFAETLLRVFLSNEDAEVIAGDLEETFRTAVVPRPGTRSARFWYWRQTLSIIAAHVLTPVAESPYSPPKRTTMAAIRQDLSYAFRSLARQPGFTAMAVLMLAIGIGANVAIFSLVNAVLLKPLPFADPGRLMMVHLLSPDREAPGVMGQIIWSYPKYQVFREHQRGFASTAALSWWNWNLTGSGSPERVIGELVESTYFDTLGLAPHLGRTFSADETRAPGSAPLAVLGHGFWVRRFGEDPAVLGRTVGLNGVAYTIVGVARPGFRGLTGEAEIWVPITTLSAAELGEAWNHSYQVVARRKTDTSVDAARAEVTVLGGRIYELIPDPFPGSGRGTGAWSATAVPLDDQRTDPLIRRSILLLGAAVASVLLIVCVNLANLMLVRGLGREREVAIRLALGASRFRIVRQLMTESLVLAIAGTLLGLAVAYAAISTGASLAPDLRMVLPGRGPEGGLTRVGLGLVGFDMTVLLVTVGMAIATAVLFGLGPAWRASRRDLTATMKAGSSGAVTSGARGLAVRNVLIAGEIALALVLLTAGGLMLKSVLRLQATELGFNPDGLLTVRVALPGPQYNAQRATQFLDQLVGRLAGHADIDAVAYGSCAPVSGGCNGTIATFPDRPPAPGEGPIVGVLWASPQYFETLGIRLIRGRAFTDRDRVGQPKVVVISEAAARAFWGKGDPIGQRIGVGQGGFHDGAEVVGVAADVRYGAVETSVRPDVYLPLLQSRRASGFIFVRSRTAPEPLVSALRRDVRALDPDLPLTDIKTMAQRFNEATWRTRTSAELLGVFAAMALVLAALGLYALMSQAVEQRRRELGVRVALGATRGDIMRLIIGRVFVLAVAGTVLGIVLAVPSMRLLTALLYQVEPTDPVIFTLLALALISVAMLSGYVPARRATRVDPLVTLRAD
jgi:putative ABC transport system permease protein